MENNKVIGVFSDEVIAQEYIRRGLRNESLDDVSDYDIKAEYEDRGFDSKVIYLTDDQFVNEVKEMEIDDEIISPQFFTLANDILTDINLKKCVKNRVDFLLQNISGRVFCQ